MASHNDTNATDEEVVNLSVQGCLFILKKKMILSHQWLLSSIFTSSIPWDKSSNGQYYVDVDPTSFRLILSILKGDIDPPNDFQKLSGSELLLLKVTARYLLLERTEKEIERISSGHEYELRRKDETIEELSRKANVYDEIENKMKHVNVQVVECKAYRTHRSRNQCGTIYIVMGDLDVDNCTPERFEPCGSCSNDRSRLYGNQKQLQSIESIDGPEDLSSWLGHVDK